MHLPALPRPRAALLLSLALTSALAAAPAAARAQERVWIPPLYPTVVRVAAGPVKVDTAGLGMRLSEGGPAGAAPRTPAAPWTPLGAAETQRLLGRLPPLVADTAAADSFAFPAETPPPPRAGRTFLASFPPRDSLQRPRSGAAPAPLLVTRRGPEGEVGTGAGVVVAFSQPMVPLSSVEAVAARAVPVRLTPQPPGRWRWIDVRTLRFEPEGRLPMATEFTVEVPAGTVSAAGRRLEEAVRWTFSTASPHALGSWPHQGPTVRDPLLFVVFDQRVDPAAVLHVVRVRAGRREVPVRLATDAEVAADSAVRALAAAAPAGRWVAFRAVRPLPGGTEIRVEVGPGTPSAEGARTTPWVQQWTFETYGPLRLEQRGCGGRSECRPGTPFVFGFNNPLAPLDSAAALALVRVEPALPGMRVEVSGTMLMVFGQGQTGTRYTVRVDGRLRDVFGQALGKAVTQRARVGEPYPGLSGPSGMMVLDPAGPPRISVFSHDHARLRVRLHRVGPEHWPAFIRRGIYRPEDGGPAPLPGVEAEARVLSIDAPPGELTESSIDLTPALREGVGQVLVAVEAQDGPPGPRRQSVYFWVQATRIGLTAFVGPDLVGWASSLVDGRPLAGARLSLGPDGPAATTNADGVATLTLPAQDPADAMLVGRLGADVAFLPRERAGAVFGWRQWTHQETSDALAWYAFTDRNLYRPGEEVRFKGWVRLLARSAGGVRLVPGAPDSVRYVVLAPGGNELARGSLPLTPLGGFDGVVRVPPGTSLGWGSVRLSLPRGPGTWGDGSVSFQVQEFRRPEYQVAASADPGPHFVRGSADVTARAAYFSGGGLPGAPVRWSVTSAPTFFAPPGWDRWSFGADERGGANRVTRREHALEGTTDATGAHHLRLDFLSADPPRSYAVSATATVEDVNRQAWTSSTGLLVHPAAVFVGLRTERGWLEPGRPLVVDVVAVDVSGRPVPGRALDVRAERLEWRRGERGWEEVPGDEQRCAATSTRDPASCSFRTTGGGRYVVTAATTDAEGRAARSTLGVWVAGAAFRQPDQAQAAAVEIVPDREQYQPGDTASLLLRLPFAPARGVLTVRRNGVERTQPIQGDGPTLAVRVPIGEDDIPNLHVGVSVTGASDSAAAPEGAARGTEFARGVVELSVPPLARRLAVEALPRDTALEPGAATEVELAVRDAAGRPVAGAEVALVVVDEAVLALAGYRLDDPLALFHPRRGDGVSEVYLRGLVLRAEPRGFEPGPGRIVGRVMGTDGEPRGGVVVTLARTGERTVTDARGYFRFTGLAEGSYTLTFALIGLGPATRTVALGAEGAPAVRVMLAPVTVALESIVATGAESRGFLGGILRRRDPPPPPPPPAPPPMAPPPPPPPPPSPGEAAGGRAAGDAPITLRSDFNPLAVFSPGVRTDAAGRARVPFTLPGNLTRYRVMAVAVEGGTRYGMGESAITARQPLMVRPSAPRFLNFGDRFELPVVVQNQTGRPLQVDVAARASGAALEAAGRRVTVPAGDRVEVRFPARAVRAGPARFQVAVAAAGAADAAEFTLPVWTPVSAEAFATYGTLAEGAATLPLEVPADANPAFGGLEVTTSSTALQELTDALLYLVRYPYECAEQISSRLLAVAALRDVLTAFKAQELPPPEQIQAFVEQDLARLAAMQNSDGGFAFWKRGDPSWPYVSIHAAHALARARAKGYAVPERTLSGALRYLRDVRRHIPREYPDDVRAALEAYAVYVRAELKDGRIDGEVRRLLEGGVDRLPLESAGWLLSAAAGDADLATERALLLRHVTGRATETASTATFATSYTEGEYLLLHSDRRTDGVVLEALLRAQPESELVPKTVRGLLQHRVRGRWDNTQENAWVLLALDRYFAAYERETPEFVARVWLGERYAGGHAFSGRTGDQARVSVPMRALGESGAREVTVAKEGPGRLYYRAGLRYAPRGIDLGPLQQGFAVERTYEPVDAPGDVVHEADGRWRIRAGARVRVTLTMTAPARRLHVALVDPLPAGLEPLNPALRGVEDVPAAAGGRPLFVDRGGYAWWWRTWWYEHQNLRDDRAEAFASYLPAGVYTYSYVARATTPGVFVAPPPRAEEMYSPETFGRGATDHVVVEAPGS
ncbi:MAG: alpha-2-macroglobulin family protein [Longimicrobiaceae bacterium]